MSILRFILIFFLSSSFPVSAFAQVKLPKLVSDGMVLQRDAEVKLWGWASKGEKISLSFQGENYTSIADKDGTWSVSLSGLKPGGPYSMDITGSNRIALEDIYVGDVWVASGQSNMELSMERVAPIYREELATANNPQLRFFEVPKTHDFNERRKDLSGGRWEAVTPQTIGKLSAVAYFFAKEIHKNYQVPIGIINSSLGGSPAEAWMSEEALRKFPEAHAEALQYKSETFRDSIEKSDSERINNWYRKSIHEDLGIKNNWKAEDVEISGWETMRIPGYWADNNPGAINGVVWFRKKIELPENLAKQSPELLMGRIVDADSVFVNGTFVGNTTYQYPPRIYSIPAGVLKPGENTISIRITNETGRGGFVTDKPYKIVFEESEIDLSGEWNYKVGVEMPALRGQTFIRWKPTGLFNAMINPITNYTIKGVIWYQGESNTGRPGEYEDVFTSLIEDWRSQWEQEDLPFLYVQLSNFMETKEEPGDSNWARLRDAQLRTLSVPKTGMAVAIDIGEWNDIHPLNKKDVGERLAQAARRVAYEEDVISGGPLYESFTREGDSIIINFSNTGLGLMVKNGDNLEQFAIAGNDGNFFWANAFIRDDKVVVYSPKVKDPVAVRYAWADNPEGANLFNKDGFPASPFRTDDWE